ncbi:MAG: hypothetical protein IH801_04820, partial [Nitrospinae bacterium]|nr:hypothetical protein [Nitrospinota bacterium]
GSTRIGRGTKIDNLVQVAHKVQIGQDCIVVGAFIGVNGELQAAVLGLPLVELCR